MRLGKVVWDNIYMFKGYSMEWLDGYNLMINSVKRQQWLMKTDKKIQITLILSMEGKDLFSSVQINRTFRLVAAIFDNEGVHLSWQKKVTNPSWVKLGFDLKCLCCITETLIDWISWHLHEAAISSCFTSL